MLLFINKHANNLHGHNKHAQSILIIKIFIPSMCIKYTVAIRKPRYRLCQRGECLTYPCDTARHARKEGRPSP